MTTLLTKYKEDSMSLQAELDAIRKRRHERQARAVEENGE